MKLKTCLVLLLVLSLPCTAEESPLHKKISVRFQKENLSNVLKDIGVKTGIRIAFAEKLVEHASLVTYKAEKKPAGRILSSILYPRGLKLSSQEGKLTAVVKHDRYEEFRIKREEKFKFEKKPKVTRKGDNITIEFETEGFPDCTVALENSEGKIIRHLASGVLGLNAPEPFQWNSKKQKIVWDGKDDQGRYVDDKGSVTVRVSLGLKPRFERSLFWSPKKRLANACPLLVAAPEGVYVFEGRGADHVRLFGHDGGYIRTVYPFPAHKLEKAVGLVKRVFPQDGKKLPIKNGFVQASLLNSGTSSLIGIKYKFGDGYGATAMAVQGKRIALAYDYINRLGTDGTTGGVKLTGAKIGRRAKWHGYGGHGGGVEIVGPASIAFSPDGKTLYLTGYMWREFYMGGGNCLNGVLKLDYGKNTKPAVFAGKMETDKGAGSDNNLFKVPTSVACDAKGRVYVTDHMNDRIQIFSPKGTYLKTIKSTKPALVLINPKNGRVWVFSWPVIGISNDILRKKPKFAWNKVKPMLTRYGSFENPEKISSIPLPVGFNSRGFFLQGPMVNVTVDWWAKSPTLWIVGRKHNISRIDVAWGGSGAYAHRDRDAWKNDGIRLFVEKKGKWNEKHNFSVEAKKDVFRLKPPDFSRQRLYVNPMDGMLYVGEDSGFSKSFYQMLEINPNTGKIKPVELPFDTEDLCFDITGMAYLRTDTLVVRYNSRTWREIPWDYGEEHDKVGFTSLGGSRRTNIISGLATPGRRPVCWNAGGMGISPKGYLIVSCCNQDKNVSRKARGNSVWERSRNTQKGKAYIPEIYPGRPRWQEVHVWDKHGKLIYDDAVPGTGILDGVEMDWEGNIYLMAASNRILDGKPYFNEFAGTVIKFKPKAGKVISSSGGAITLSKELRPKRNMDIERGMCGSAWVEGAEWFYGGVGYGGFNPSHSGGGCHCWNSKFALDYFARSFAPEVDHYSVAVLDSNGNLILRIGKYGNVDDGVPLVPHSGIKNPKSIGGDEVALFHAAYVNTHTDRRLFITDGGNARILSVKLGYHTDEKILLKNVPNR